MPESVMQAPSQTSINQSINQDLPQENQPRPKKTFVYVIILVSISVIGIVGWILFGKLGVSPKAADIQAGLTDPSPTPIAFREMTIPYLREQQFKSSLTTPEEVSSNANYRSYTTSYDSEGNSVNALLTIPSGTEPEGGWPAIVFIHGYIPPTLYQTLGPQYADYVDYLARNGFVVLKIDLRGHAESEGEPGGGYYGSDYVIDALNAYSALQSADFVNSRQVGMWGHSMAGNILMRSIAAKPDIPAIVIWAGAVYSYQDMQKYGIDDNSYRPPTNVTRTQQRRRELFEKQGSPSATSPFWQQVAPTNYLGDIKGAIEIHHAVDDTVVNVGYSRDLMALLDKTSVEHELHEYTSGGHNISGSSFVQAMQGTVDFFKKHLTK